MKFTQQTVINAPVEQVDLEDWLFTLSDSDYQATAKGHKAAGTFTTDGVRGMVNVESIDNVLIVQYYLKVKADSTHVEMLSETQPSLLGAPDSHQRVGPRDDDRLGPNRGHH